MQLVVLKALSCLQHSELLPILHCSSRRTPSAPLSRLPSVAPVLFPSCSSNSPPSSRRRPESSPHLSSISFMKRLTLVTLNLAAPMAWYTSAAPTRLVLLVVASLLPTVSAQLPKLMPLSAGKMSSDSTSGRTSRGSVFNSPNRPLATPVHHNRRLRRKLLPHSLSVATPRLLRCPSPVYPMISSHHPVPFHPLTRWTWPSHNLLSLQNFVTSLL